MSELSTNALKARRGCVECRKHRVRCDLAKPRCSKCRESETECVRDDEVRFKHTTNASNDSQRNGDFSFDHQQRWMNVKGDLRFLDETRDLMSQYDHEPTEYPETATPWDRAVESPAVVQGRNNTLQDDGTTVESSSSWNVDDGHFESLASPAKRRRVSSLEAMGDSTVATSTNALVLSPTNSWLRSAHGQNITSTQDFQSDSLHRTNTVSTFQSRGSAGNGTHMSTTAVSPEDYGSRPTFSPASEPNWRPTPSQTSTAEYATSPDTPGRLYLKKPVWPLEKLEEARLLRHFVDHLARSFDLTDPDRHFRVVVPQRAGTCPTLLNAIFALSARHLSRIGDYDPLISDHYHQLCLKHLIPMLDDSTAVLDENLLASTIILRHLEEIELPLSGQSSQSHLTGAHIFLEAQVRATLAGGLREAAFWVGLRQEIFVAFVNQRSIMPQIERSDVDRSCEPAADSVWSCRMVLLCANVIRYCFGDTDHPTRTYRELSDANNEWYERKPKSFTPIYYEDSNESNVFPTVWYLREEIMVGLQHYHIAQILLSAHNPKVPRIGPGRAAALRRMDNEIKEHVKILCGMCQSNPDISPNYSYAAMAITIAGDKFTEPTEQAALLNLMDICDKRHAHHTGRAQDNLKAAWGWT